MPSKGDAHTASGISGTGAEALAGKGDFVTVRNSVVRRFQAAYVGDVVLVVNRIRHKYAGIGARQLEPVQEKRAIAQNPQREPAFEPVRTGSKPVHEPPMNHPEPVFEPLEPVCGSMFPITEKRPLTKRESAVVRHLAESMSKNALCLTVYGAKSGRYLEWINAALEPFQIDGKIIKLRKVG
jgi:hypothetical protein